MSGKNITTLVVVAGVVLLGFMLLQKRTVKTAPVTTGRTTSTGSSVWADVGAGVAGAIKGFFGNDSSSSSGNGGGYTWGGYQDSDTRLGGE